jgi:hypothetical protein
VRALAVAVLLVAPSGAQAAKPQVLTVQVVDGVTNQIIPNAEVRLPGTEGRREVDTQTGIWEASMLYTFEGKSVIFTKGMELDVTVSAPGYVAVSFEYLMRTKKNVVIVPLNQMEERKAVLEAEDDETMIQWFKRTPSGTEEGT